MTPNYDLPPDVDIEDIDFEDIPEEKMPDEVAECIFAAIRREQELRELPEQELCTDCAVDDDPATEPGVPQDVVARSTEQTMSSLDEWDEDAFGPLPVYDVVRLACGHTMAQLVS